MLIEYEHIAVTHGLPDVSELLLKDVRQVWSPRGEAGVWVQEDDAWQTRRFGNDLKDFLVVRASI